MSLDRLTGSPPRLGTVRAWILYSALRIGTFLVLFGLLYALTATVWPGTAWVIAAVGAAVLALCISYIFFKPLRERVALELVAAREGSPRRRVASVGSDEDIEDRLRDE